MNLISCLSLNCSVLSHDWEVIVARLREESITAGGTAFRTAYLMKPDAGQREIKESLVGRFPKIKLDIRELNFYHSTWLNSPPDTEQQWDV